MKQSRTALVTGANRGIGLAVCRKLLDRGLRVLLGARDLDKGRTEARTRVGRGGVAGCLVTANRQWRGRSPRT
jgi:NAD(P)-dependent dehydrogenase (short-subunit alcohol dehydrogenase family)